MFHAICCQKMLKISKNMRLVLCVTIMILLISASPSSASSDQIVLDITSTIPAETEKNGIEIAGTVFAEYEVANIKIQVENFGTIGITTYETLKRQREPFNIYVPLNIGESTITFEVNDKAGQNVKQVFTVVRVRPGSSASQPAPQVPTPLPPLPTPTPLPAIPTPIPELSPTVAAEVKRLLATADQYFDQQWYFTPEETNAYAIYRQVLEIDPPNTHARERLTLMMVTYNAWADNNLEKGDAEKAATYYQRSLDIARYFVDILGDQRKVQDLQTIQEQLHTLDIEVALESQTPPASQSDAPPAIKLTFLPPETTEQETLQIEGIATDDVGIKEVNIRVQQPGQKGLTIAAGVYKARDEFSTLVDLAPGQNDIIIEATDTSDQKTTHTYTVMRTSTSPADLATTQIQQVDDTFTIERPYDVYAVIIGIGDYQDERIPDLAFTVNDAQGLYDVLTHPNYGGVPEDHVQLLLNEAATDRSIKGAIGKWLSRQAAEEDMVIIYYSGHGAPEGGDTYWVTSNADIDDLYTTALSNSDISDMLNRIQAKRMITFLDSCYSAATVKRKNQTRSLVTEIPWEKFSGEGRVTISASDGKQLSLELEAYKHGVFTYYLLEGLKGSADLNEDGVIEVDEVWDYVKFQVTETARKAGNSQTPVFQGSHTAGLPLTFNFTLFQQQQQEQHIAEKQEKLKSLLVQGLLLPEQFNCAYKMLQEAKTDPLLEGFLSGGIDPDVFRNTFQCSP